MKITHLEIRPENRYRPISDENRLRATVKMRDSSHTELETDIPQHLLGPLMQVLVPIVAKAAEEQIKAFADQAWPSNMIDHEGARNGQDAKEGAQGNPQVTDQNR